MTFYPHATQTYRLVRHVVTLTQGRWPCQGLRPFLSGGNSLEHAAILKESDALSL